MTITELIEKHADYDGGRRALRKFAIDLLEMVKNKGDNVPENLCPQRHQIAIEKALAELKEKP